jgi:hypothetical protein
MTAEVEHTDVAAYALGLLEESDRTAFEAHLAECTLCREELGDFAGMGDLLRDVPPLDPPSPEEEAAGGQVIDLLRRRKAVERSRRRTRTVLGAAAGIVLLAGGVTAGIAMAGDQDKAPRTTAMPGHNALDDIFKRGEKAAASDRKTGVSGMVAMQSKGWGTDVGLELTHLKGPLVCKLVAVSKSGQRHTVAEWRVPPKGYGLPGSLLPKLQVHGGTAVERADLARFDVQVEGSGRSLLSIPV